MRENTTMKEGEMRCERERESEYELMRVRSEGNERELERECEDEMRERKERVGSGRGWERARSVVRDVGERYSTLYREISIMRICNFNASPNPAKLPKRKPAASTLRANPEHRGSSLVHPSPRSLRRVPGFRVPPPPPPALHFTPARPPSPLSSPSRNPITPRATSYVQQPNPHTRTRRAFLPRDQIDFVRVSSSGLLFSDFFAIVKRCLTLSSLTLAVGTDRIN